MLTQIQIDSRMNAFLGRPGGGSKRPAVIHLHERYGIVQHTTDLAQKLVAAGYVTIVPDLFSRFTNRSFYPPTATIFPQSWCCTAQFTMPTGKLIRSVRSRSTS